MRTIYFLRNADGEVLYIGCTYRLNGRLGNIRLYKKWWPEVADVRSYKVPENRAAEEEHAAIRQFQPRYNTAGITRRYTPPIGHHSKPNARKVAV